MKVRDVIKLLQGDGSVLVRTRGSHRQYKHPEKPGRVTEQEVPTTILRVGRSI